MARGQQGRGMLPRPPKPVPLPHTPPHHTTRTHTYTHTYALATLNLLFSLALTGCVVYVFREYEMGLPVKHLVSVVSALLVCAGLVYGNAL